MHIERYVILQLRIRVRSRVHTNGRTDTTRTALQIYNLKVTAEFYVGIYIFILFSFILLFIYLFIIGFDLESNGAWTQ